MRAVVLPLCICRVFIYCPFVIKKGTLCPIIISIAGFVFCALNGYMQGRYLTNFVHYDTSWFYDPRFVVGNILFLVGMAINIQSDVILRTLRKPGETGYKIPHGEDRTLFPGSPDRIQF